MQQVGGSIGTALLSTLAAGATTSYLSSHDPAAVAAAAVHGYQLAYLISCGIFLVGAVLAATLLTGRRAKMWRPYPWTDDHERVQKAVNAAQREILAWIVAGAEGDPPRETYRRPWRWPHAVS
jgi:hypothetical protein